MEETAKKTPVKHQLAEWAMITAGCIMIILGSNLFKFPNHFSFGGISGLSVIIGAKTTLSPSMANLVINAGLLVLGFIFLGRDFGIKTVYATIVIAVGMELLDRVYPMAAPFTDQKLLELIFAVVLPGVGSALLFFCDASGGGTDIIAMIMKKYFAVDIGTGLIAADFLITMLGWWAFGTEVFLFSLLGMMSKSLVVDRMVRSLNMSKVINIICSDPEPVCNYIMRGLNRGATVMHAEGAYTHKPCFLVMTALKKREALRLRRYLKQSKIDAFITVTETNEIFGKGFNEKEE